MAADLPAPGSTYRLQITADLDLNAAREVVPYLRALGVDWVYLSPLLTAEPGSGHGYDVIDHSAVDPARGGAAGLQALADDAHAAGLGVLVDIVPNHVGVQTPHLSVWWWDLLRHGRSAVHGEYFDVDWEVDDGRIHLPVLGDGPDELDRLEVVDDELRYYENRYPIAPGTGSGTPQQVHDRQHYRLMNWRLADTELNYRRFFAVNSLAAIRVERPEVFRDSHAEIRRWLDNGWVDGLRVDHPDGLAHPGDYLRDLADLAGGRYLLVEKILEPGEELPADWPCDGTTGYDALALLDRVFVDPAGEATLDALDIELRGGAQVHWHDMIATTKRWVADELLASEVSRLARLIPEIDGPQDALAALLAEFPVYRSYLPAGRNALDEAVRAVLRRRPAMEPVLREIVDALGSGGTEFATRFEQVSGAVTAKGVEDRAFYRWSRLTSLTEVGADPSLFAVDVPGFHAAQQHRLTSWPRAMTTLSTHDTKRSEDVRARISVLAERADWWAEQVRLFRRLAPLPDGPLANLVWQAVVGSWPLERERLRDYAIKAAREAGVSTSWTDGDTAFEDRLAAMVDAAFDLPELREAVDAAAALLTGPGWSNAISAKLLQLAGPGVPDVYQGTELGAPALVDPDNRLPVDFVGAAATLRRLDGGAAPAGPDELKLLVTATVLRLRRDRPELFTGYRPLYGDGSAGDHLVAFDRGGMAALATRLPLGLADAGGWGDTTVTLSPGSWRNQLDPGAPAVTGTVPVIDVLAGRPVAVLVREADDPTHQEDSNR
ncbi:malto-oligosyltrehalose synthase [Nakamurella sp. YIM 132087]|uniref:Malto-oligosyltrehalose synthase n=1 Tax=Nakamurella alba TaxID=2665158 RepID=A0A7K1FIP8_9ACTN|nr:malto-oligosyltrehalose synthase [Nakamurella alba]MTD13950.1 malto-oligosyltrehalose synthase [Nakamurella alba]